MIEIQTLCDFHKQQVFLDELHFQVMKHVIEPLEVLTSSTAVKNREKVIQTQENACNTFRAQIRDLIMIQVFLSDILDCLCNQSVSFLVVLLSSHKNLRVNFGSC